MKRSRHSPAVDPDAHAETGDGAASLTLAVPLKPLEPGLYLVACPIGNLADVTLRALAVLATADVLACEDTRYTGRLLQAHGIERPAGSLVAYHDHNAPRTRPKLIAALQAGRSVALVSDAGTPLVSDPGYKLVRAAAEAGVRAIPVPGPSAVMAGLVAAGLPSDRFCFAGFAPPKPAARRRWLGELAAVPATLVLFEAPQRLAESLADMAAVLGPGREAAVARELTKLFEEVRRGSLDDLAAAYAAEEQPKGEIVVLVGPPGDDRADAGEVDARLRAALAEGASLKDAVRTVQIATGLPRKQVYGRALALQEGSAAGGTDDAHD
jgi:16S rRNA (cytidine1402-2'-O)-methyltransferase